MSKAERIIERCPRFYKCWDSDSVISNLIKGISGELDNAENSVSNLMSAHWVDTASGVDLDKIGITVGLKRSIDEDDEHFRSHLKRAVDEYKGGGTIVGILKELKNMLGEDGFTIVENPEVESFAEFIVIANDTWNLGSSSVFNEQSTLSLTVEDEGTVSNPKITNIDTGQSITFTGELKTGEQLVIRENSAYIGEKDVSKKISLLGAPELLRKGSFWRYSEALLERIGVFDQGKFDEHTFAIGVPKVKVHYDWIRRQPATFLVKIKPEALYKSAVTENYVQEKMSCLRAAGIKVIVTVTE